MSTQDKIKEAITLVEEGLASIATDSEWLNFLKFQSLFYQYSYSNTILIYLQNPEATFVKGYKAWNKLGRYVVKGGKGLKILAPCYRKMEVFKEPENKAEYHQQEGEKEVKRVLSGFKVTHVFDISDTAGSDEYLPVLVRGLSGNGDDVKELYEKVLAVVSKEYPVKEVFKTASKGSYNLETKQICVRGDMEYLQRLKSLCHEYAHAIHFMLRPEDDLSRAGRELVAEASAFVVCNRLGADTADYSISYLKSWMSESGDLRKVMDDIQKVSYTILTKLAESQDFASFHLQEDNENEG